MAGCGRGGDLYCVGRRRRVAAALGGAAGRGPDYISN